MHHDIRKLVREMKTKGWMLSHRRSGHLRLTHPGGRYVSLSLTPSDRNAVKNIRRDIEKIERLTPMSLGCRRKEDA